MTRPKGFFEVTGAGTLRSIMLRADTVLNVGWSWSHATAQDQLDYQRKMHEVAKSVAEAGGDPDFCSPAPPENAKWYTIIHHKGGTLNAVEDLEEVCRRLAEAVSEERFTGPRPNAADYATMGEYLRAIMDWVESR